MSSFASIDSNIKEPHFRRAWRDDDDGTLYATVNLGRPTLFFDSAQDARAVAAACIEAAEALERLQAKGGTDD